MLIRFKPGAKAAGLMLFTRYNRQGKRLTLAWPVASILGDLFAKFAWFEQAPQALAYLAALVAGASVFSAVNSSMSARKRDLAILRALGAHRGFLIAAVLAESAGIGLLGCVLGFGLYAAIASTVLPAWRGYRLSVAEGLSPLR